MRELGNSSSEFKPEELDLLEDALEWVGDPAHRAEIDALPAPVRARAEEFASILALAREALPEEDVAPGLLDGILAEARQAAPAPATRERGPGLWERLRRSVVLPGLALAGTAALLLWVARPVDEAPSVHDAAAPAPAAQEPSRAPGGAPAEADKLELKDMVEETAVPSASPIEAQPAPAEAAASAEPILPPATAKPTRAGGGGGAAKAKKAEAEAPLPGLDVVDEKRVDADKETVRDRLDAGDLNRRQGRCDLAQTDYTAVARSNGPAAERARALVGLGLCREAAGDESGAERYFDEARRLDANVDAWLRNEGAGKPSKKSKKATADGL